MSDQLQPREGTARDHERSLERARRLAADGRLRDAEDAYAAMLSGEPDDARVWLEAGRLADELGETARACERLTAAVARSRTAEQRASAWHGLAIALMHADRPDKAARAWRRAAGQATVPRHRVTAWVGLAACAVACGRPCLARQARRRALQDDDFGFRQTFADAWLHLWPLTWTCAADTPGSGACRARGSGRDPLTDAMRRAEAKLRRAVERHPQRADAQFHLANACAALNQTDRAATAIGHALRINPNYAAAQRLADRLNAPAA